MTPWRELGQSVQISDGFQGSILDIRGLYGVGPLTTLLGLEVTLYSFEGLQLQNGKESLECPYNELSSPRP